MSAVTIQQMAERVSSMMGERLGIRGVDLTAKLKRGGRVLPRRVRSAAQDLARAAEMSKNPRLLVQVDEGQVASQFDICIKHLSAIDRRSRRLGALMGMAASVALGLLVLGAGAIAILRWRGYI